MIVPQFWAEGRVRHRDPNRQVTVRRFGWSDESQAAAQSHADARAQEALAKVLSGKALARRVRNGSLRRSPVLVIRQISR